MTDELNCVGTFSLRFVTLDTVEIFTTHEWFGKPTVYFRCNGENKIYLPDVKEAHTLYTFKGEESWQPLTELPEKKCKRCGVYEEDTFKPADVFDEWEMCSSDFKDGKYTRLKENQFNATFICLNCTASAVSVLASVLVIIALFLGYKYWQKKKREMTLKTNWALAMNSKSARFLKLFEEGDDLEDELGLSNEL
ncbi:hypothetical protein C2845_PM01G11390 [Panicum miliaceum]|uniref:DUF7953 domain-containing protein n=1 Tax=Panicum miliaceum TaxID=4540 RepID=A0A3L6TIV8_PANMI|nr:hypothetical protein C2845_PM01G11390 [Panicum miliaceum]